MSIRSSFFFNAKPFSIDDPESGLINASPLGFNGPDLQNLKEEKFKRELGIKSQEIAQAKVFAALTDPKEYLKARSNAYQKMVKDLMEIYEKVKIQNLSSGMSQLQAEQLATSAILPLKATMEASFNLQFPADAQAFDRSIRKQKATAL